MKAKKTMTKIRITENRIDWSAYLSIWKIVFLLNSKKYILYQESNHSENSLIICN